jgi:manganese oxidase
MEGQGNHQRCSYVTGSFALRSVLMLAVAVSSSCAREEAITLQNGVAVAVPNDNREAGGRLRRGAYSLQLEAKLAAWKPDADADSMVTVQAFAEEGTAPRIPAPLVRVPEGTEIRLSVRNSIADSTLTVHGLRAGTMPNDTVHVKPGTVREVTYIATTPGTYLYWGTTRGSQIGERWSRDSQLTGAIVIDSAGARRRADDRIFVLTLIDIYSDPSRPPTKEDIWELAINGRSWPHTERIEVPVGDTAHWRWLNGTLFSHPMHLHGFHFKVTAKGDGYTDNAYAKDVTRLAVTELMEPGSSFAMEWVPTRPGNWLMHCHMLGHITPYPVRADSIRGHDSHNLQSHPLSSMAGLVLGITSTGGATAEKAGTPVTSQRLLLQEANAAPGKPRARGFVLQRDAEPRPDSVELPGPPLVLKRGETVAITVVNRLQGVSSIHWHGMELQSLYDGVAGWSGSPARLAPLIARGDSFMVSFTPPRAGTYIYHTHMDEEDQLPAGMFGPMLVLEPGEVYDPAKDLIFMVGVAVVGGDHVPLLHGKPKPEPMTLRAGSTYRLRLININPVEPLVFELVKGDTPMQWRALSKDGALLPPVLQKLGPARQSMGVGETYDFEWVAAPGTEATFVVRPSTGKRILEQTLRVR